MDSLIKLLVYVGIFVVWLVAQAAGGCAPDESRARRILHASGYSHVELGAYPWFECGAGDVFNIEFSAVAANATVVRGALCCGLFKNCTPRLD